MTNSAAFCADDLRAIFREQAIIPDYYASIGVCTDTRNLQPGSLFVALKGERFDAHDHIHSAILQGAVAVLFEDRWMDDWINGPGRSFPAFARIVVPDSLVALADLARYHRKRFAIPIVAIAGANGKTTTKDLSAHVLSSEYLTLKTEANYNNRVGTPLTLLQLSKFHEAAVIEIGTNEPGEIELLADMVQPTHALITNIGEEHLEKLIDLDGVEKEETALFQHTLESKAITLVNMDDERLSKYLSTLLNAFSFGTKASENVQLDLSASFHFDQELKPVVELRSAHAKAPAIVQMQTIGYASALNAIAAAAVGLSVGLRLEIVASALQNYSAPPVHGYARMQVQELHLPQHVVLLNDCYNANPSSMRMALQTLSSYPAKRRVALLGDMRELGEAAPQAHAELLQQALIGANLVVLIGDDMLAAAANLDAQILSESNATIIQAASHEAAARKLLAELQDGDVLLVKASRGMALENVVNVLSSEHNTQH